MSTRRKSISLALALVLLLFLILSSDDSRPRPRSVDAAVPTQSAVAPPAEGDGDHLELPNRLALLVSNIDNDPPLSLFAGPLLSDIGQDTDTFEGLAGGHLADTPALANLGGEGAASGRDLNALGGIGGIVLGGAGTVIGSGRAGPTTTNPGGTPSNGGPETVPEAETWLLLAVGTAVVVLTAGRVERQHVRQPWPPARRRS